VPKSTARWRFSIESRYSGKLSHSQVMPSARAVPVLDALHQFDEPLLAARPHRREPDTAVAAHHGRHAMQTGRLERLVPADLTVVVGVNVDEPRGDHAARRVDGSGRLLGDACIIAVPTAHLDDAAVLDTDVGREAIGASPVHDGAPGDLQVVHGVPLHGGSDASRVNDRAPDGARYAAGHTRSRHLPGRFRGARAQRSSAMAFAT
jgi:hypothetical protein